MMDQEQVQRELVVAEALSWVGTPYLHEGRVKSAGVDCAMLIADVFYQCGLIPWVDPRPYSAQFHLHHSEERYLEFLQQHTFSVSNPLPGDIVTFKVGLCISHAGIVTEWPLIVHSYAQARICTVDEVTSIPALNKRLSGFLRYSGWEADA